MMREIKFRVWDVKFNCYESIPELLLELTSGVLFEDAPDKHNTPNREIEGAKNNYILEQYTGLKDKNGKEIYEGDILRGGGSFLGQPTKYKYGTIIWDDERAQWWLIPCDSTPNCPLHEQHKDVEVIGNIHENPELLEPTDAK